MENRDKKAGADFATSGSLGVILTKNTKKMMKIFDETKKTKNIRRNLNKLFKNVQISPIHKADYFSNSILRCVFFDVVNMKSRASCFFETISPKIHTC